MDIRVSDTIHDICVTPGYSIISVLQNCGKRFKVEVWTMIYATQESGLRQARWAISEGW